MQAFIVRPFNIQQGVDFTKVEEELIQPALKAIGVIGKTTTEIIAAGNIRKDMFSLLLTADLVIADLSIHNANVFYELGIRHALRDKRTFFIRCSIDEIPFDLKTDRYLNYPADNPSLSLGALIKGLSATLRSNQQDSPIFNILTSLEAQDPEPFLEIPQDFKDQVEVARAGEEIGMLGLLAAEVLGFPWEIPALRLIAEVQFSLKALEGARLTWEKVRDRLPDDHQANVRLATLYQHFAEVEIPVNPLKNSEIIENSTLGWKLLSQSDLAIDRLQKNFLKLNKNQRAETYSLRAGNIKVRWIDTWRKELNDKIRWTKALRSSLLKEAFQEYELGFSEDLHHFYCGINALGLLTVMISLAKNLPDIWEAEYSDENEADWQLKKYQGRQQKLIVILQASIDVEKARTQQHAKQQHKLNITEAELGYLTLMRSPRVNALYQRVINETDDLNIKSAKRQLETYEQLNIMPENVKAALAAFPPKITSPIQKKKHYLLFIGHSIDKPQAEVRFPEIKQNLVRTVLKQTILKEKDLLVDEIIGIAGGACGGDILFHEVCEELGIKTELYLPFQREQFLLEFVQFAGSEWVDRFDRLYRKLPQKVLSNSKELPIWLIEKPDYSLIKRNNLWILYSILVSGGIQMTLIALWDKQDSINNETRHMIKEAEERGVKSIVIDINSVS